MQLLELEQSQKYSFAISWGIAIFQLPPQPKVLAIPHWFVGHATLRRDMYQFLHDLSRRVTVMCSELRTNLLPGIFQRDMEYHLVTSTYRIVQVVPGRCVINIYTGDHVWSHQYAYIIPWVVVVLRWSPWETPKHDSAGYRYSSIPSVSSIPSPLKPHPSNTYSLKIKTRPLSFSTYYQVTRSLRHLKEPNYCVLFILFRHSLFTPKRNVVLLIFTTPPSRLCMG